MTHLSNPNRDFVNMVLETLGLWPTVSADQESFTPAMVEAFLNVLRKEEADRLRESIATMLKDPVAVHANVLRGGIAKLTPAQIGHIYRGDEANEVVVELVRQNPDTAFTHVEELHLLEEVCAFYANDEDAVLDDTGEPYGSIPTEVGMAARSARRRFQEREKNG